MKSSQGGKQAKCKQGNQVMCGTISRGDGRAAVIKFYSYISSYM